MSAPRPVNAAGGHVDRHDPVPRLGAVKILFGAAGDTSIIDQHIEFAEVSGGGGHDGGPALLICHIKRFEPRRGAGGIGHCRASCSSTSAITTLAPSRANMRAVAAPMPDAAPEMMATLSRESHGCLPFASSADYLTTALLTEREGSNAGPRSP
jgi:hypothetical protein